MTIRSATVQRYNSVEQMVFMTDPQSSELHSTPVVLCLQSGRLSIDSHLWQLQHLTITWSPFAAFGVGFSRKGKPAKEIASHWDKSLSPIHPPLVSLHLCCTVSHRAFSWTPMYSSQPTPHLCLPNNHRIWLMVVIGTTSLSNGNSGRNCCYNLRTTYSMFQRKTIKN